METQTEIKLAIGLSSDESSVQIINSDGEHVAQVDIYPTIETAEHIVKCCNTHDNLVAALQAAEKTIETILYKYALEEKVHDLLTNRVMAIKSALQNSNS